MLGHTMRIGTLDLATNVLLAPMSGYADTAFRLVVRRLGGVGLAFTPLLSPRAVLSGHRKSQYLGMTHPDDVPLAFQFFGADADWLADAARWAEDRGAHAVDLNMGCPVDKVTRSNGGSRLLREPERAVRLAESVARALRRIPLTVKMRIGWNDESIVAPSLAARLEGVGVAAVTVHGRTAAMGYSGTCRAEAIAAVVAAVKQIPIIGNGDVRSPADAERMMERTGCAGVMIGRGALSAPWALRDTWAYLTTGRTPAEPTLEEKCNLMREHFGNLLRLRDERTATLEFRKAGIWYARRMQPSRMLRERMPRIRSAKEFEEVVSGFLEWRRGREERKDLPQIAQIAQMEEVRRGTEERGKKDHPQIAQMEEERRRTEGISGKSVEFV